MSIAIIAMALLLPVLAAMPSAQGFGEYSGHLIYNVSVNSSHTEYWTLINNYNYSLSFYIVPPNLTSSSSNVTPELTFSVMNGSIGPGKTYTINVTAYVPAYATPGTTWQGYATAFANPSGNQTGAARVQIGTAKYMQITAEPAAVKKSIKATTTIPAASNATAGQQTATHASQGSEQEGIIIGIIIALVVVLIAGVSYAIGSRGRKKKDDMAVMGRKRSRR